MKLSAFLIFLASLLLAACGGTPVPINSSIAEAGPINLGLNIDVDTAAAVQNRDDVILIDVREQWEYDEAHIPNITLIPMSEIESRLDEIPTDKEVVLTCRSGRRSHEVTQLLLEKGFDNVHNMEGGILAWEDAGLPVER